MSIFDKIWKALKDILPFLAKAAEKTFNELEDAAQTAGIDGSKFAQIIKENVDAASEDVKNKLLSDLSFDETKLNELLEAFRVEYKLPAEVDVINSLQHKLITAESELLHSSKANEIFTIAATVLSKGKLTWVTLLMGVGEYIYRKFVKGRDMTIVARGQECPQPAPTNKPTPYGYWSCSNGKWVWVPELG